MKKIIIGLILMGLAAFALKLFLENKYESKLDDAIAMARPFVDIRYEKVEIGFDSSISIKNIKITAPDFDDTVAIRLIRVNSSDALFPLKGDEIFKNNNFPEKFSVDINGIDVDAELIDKANEGKECRSVQSVMRYTAAGLDRVNSSMRFELNFRDPTSSGGNIRILDQLSTTTIELEMDATQIASAAFGGDIPIKKIELTTELDPDLAKELNEYCAKVFKVPMETFLTKVVGSEKFSQNTFGADLGSDMNKAVIEYIKGGKRFSFRARPSATMGNINSIFNLRPDQILSRLNLSVSLDGLRVPLLIARETVEEKQERVDEKKNLAEERNKRRSYVKVDLATANQYIGQRIRLVRKGEKSSIKGRMSGFKDNRVALEVYRHGGEMTLNVAVSDIKAFEVYR